MALEEAHCNNIYGMIYMYAFMQNKTKHFYGIVSLDTWWIKQFVDAA